MSLPRLDATRIPGSQVSNFSLPRSGPYRWALASPGPTCGSAPSSAASTARPLQAWTPPRAVPGRALRELRGGCSRRPGGRRREAVPQFVSNQGVRAVPRAGQQCVNKPTATPPPPRRARPAPAAAAAAAGFARLAPARLPGRPPRPAPPAPPRPRPAPAGAGAFTYRPTRARSRTTRPSRPARLVASREQGKGDARGLWRFSRPAGPGEVSGVAVFRPVGGQAPGSGRARQAGGGCPAPGGHKLPNLPSGRAGRLRGWAGVAPRGAGGAAGPGAARARGGPRGTFSSPEGLLPAPAAAPPPEQPAPWLEGAHEMCLKKLTQFVTLAAS